MTAALPKLLALIFSVILGTGYIWFRSGGNVPYLSPAKQAKPDRNLLPGSKSIIHRTDYNTSYGMKSALPAIEALIVEPVSNPVTKYSQYRPPNKLEAADPRFVMPSSKSGKIFFEFGPQADPKSEPKPQPQPVINNPKPLTPRETPSEPATPTKEKKQRAFLPGSKSFSVSPTTQIYHPPTQKTDQPTPPAATEDPKPRTLLPGSKSFGLAPPEGLKHKITLLRPRLDPSEKPKAAEPAPATSRQSSIQNRQSPTGEESK